MATAGDGRTPYDSGGSGEKPHKRPFLPDLNEEPENDQEAGQNNSSGVSELSTDQVGSFATIGISELEQILKQKTFTISETQHLISLLHSRTCDNDVVEKDGAKPPLSRLESSTRGSLKKHKQGDSRDNFHTDVVSSRVLEEDIASPSELANTYKGSTICTGQAPRKYLKLNNGTGFPITSIASPQQPTTMENLPEEILSNIFIRLLAKQLAQMRSVNKSWNALLSHSSFVRSHLHRSVHNNDQILLVFYDLYSHYDLKPFTAHSCRSPHLELTDFIKLPEFKNNIEAIGSVNGLICYFDGFDIRIWNPSLSAVLTLPPYSDGCDSAKCYFRFGFDPKTDDYKVVILSGVIGPPYDEVKCWLRVEIYSMRNGSWEFITETIPSHITDIYENEVVCVDGHDGRLHWFGEKMKTKRIILAFDLGSETFREIPLPHSTLVHLNGLGVLAGKLCVMSQVNIYGMCEVWVMEDYGVPESWVNRHVFSQFVHHARPFGFTSHNEFLIEDNRYLVLYDPISSKQTIFSTYHHAKSYQPKIVEYVDSLVWVAPAKREMVDDDNSEMSSDDILSVS